MKAHEIVQNSTGKVFCLPYFYEGMFRIVVFDHENTEIDHVKDINDKLGIDNNSTPPLGFLRPLINATFC